MEEEWDKLIQEFLGKMRAVRCDIEDFQGGLRQAAEEIQTELQASKESQ